MKVAGWDDIFHGSEIKVGSLWQGSSGSIVEVVDVKEFHSPKNQEMEDGDFDIFYKSVNEGNEIFRDIDSFNFQRLYCPILTDDNIKDYEI